MREETIEERAGWRVYIFELNKRGQEERVGFLWPGRLPKLYDLTKIRRLLTTQYQQLVQILLQNCPAQRLPRSQSIYLPNATSHVLSSECWSPQDASLFPAVVEGEIAGKGITLLWRLFKPRLYRRKLPHNVNQ